MSQRPVALATLPSTPDAMAGPTQSSWGRTGDAGSSARRIGRWVAIAAVGVLAAGALIAFAVTRTDASAETVEPAVEPVASPAATAPEPSAVEPVPPLETATASAASSAVEPVPSPEASVRVQHPAVKSPPPTRDKGSTSKPPSGTITDFGGRR
jgi:hypothetical protein